MGMSSNRACSNPEVRAMFLSYLRNGILGREIGGFELHLLRCKACQEMITRLKEPGNESIDNESIGTPKLIDQFWRNGAKLFDALLKRNAARISLEKTNTEWTDESIELYSDELVNAFGILASLANSIQEGRTISGNELFIATAKIKVPLKVA